MMADAAGDLKFDGVTYTVDWIVRELVIEEEGTYDEQARYALHAAHDALSAKVAGARGARTSPPSD